MQNSQFHFIHLDLSMAAVICSILITASTEEWANSAFLLPTSLQIRRENKAESEHTTTKAGWKVNEIKI